jgi:putative spermidine/putrescine transport system permease protein
MKAGPGFGRLDRRVWLLAPALVVLTLAFLWPVGWLLSRAFTQPQPGLGNFVQLVRNPGYLQVLGNTFLISAIVTPICVIIGFPVAHAMTHSGPRVRRILVFVVLIPFWTSLLVRSFATVILLGRNGPVNGLLQAVGLTSEPVPLLYNLFGVLAGAVQVLLPFVIFPLHAVMLRIDPTLLPAAMTLGARPIRAFVSVYLPLTLPGLITGATLVFISMLGYYVTPALLGGPRQTMVAQIIQDQIAQFGNWGIAGALSLTLIAATGILLFAVHATVGFRASVR